MQESIDRDVLISEEQYDLLLTACINTKLDQAIDNLAQELSLHPGGLKKWFEQETPPESVRKKIEKKSGQSFKGGWVRVSGTTGEILGPCGRKSAKGSDEGYPKCMSYQKWKSLSKQERMNAVKRKQSADNPKSGTGNKPKLVSTQKENNSVSEELSLQSLSSFCFTEDCESPQELTVQVLSTEGGKKLLKIPVARLGRWAHPKHKVIEFTQTDFDQLKTNFSKMITGFPPYLRYGHSRFPNAVDAEASIGEIKELVQDGNVLYSINEPNNNEVIEEVRGKQYRFASPEIFRNFMDKATGQNVGTTLIALALTNAPFLPDLPENQALSMDCSDLEDYFVLNLTIGSNLEDSEVAYSASPVNEPPSDCTNSTGITMIQETDMTVNAEVESTASVVPAQSSESTQQLSSLPGFLKDKDKEKNKKQEMSKDTSDSEDEEEESKQKMSYAKPSSKEKESKKEMMSQGTDNTVVSASEANTELASKLEMLSSQVTQMSTTYQDQINQANQKLSEMYAANSLLETKLRETETKTQYLSSQAYQAELRAQKQSYLEKGVFPFVVDKVFDIISSVPDTQEIRLSSGATATLKSQLEDLLDNLPNAMKADYQMYSSAATESTTESQPSAYKKAGIIR